MERERDGAAAISRCGSLPNSGRERSLRQRRSRGDLCFRKPAIALSAFFLSARSVREQHRGRRRHSAACEVLARIVVIRMATCLSQTSRSALAPGATQSGFQELSQAMGGR
ncbi:hypothetical protein BDS110ZK4_22410 [Bradyrhizobium diazoefficiens]|uniref:Uncharacterized protein n=1 Tax=Bradyrhizobium diazoefficiens TaxID=1355477 RepID=A0A810CZ76_9BRAD|nr:hypothetical protein XF1B_53550 [Bradyrhizobium diazoefficiens]BCE48939.1 hypothetical protein XF4B_52880 [Bradyrhizobium diazoefficiens]BCE92451.1 hypothetical protein XF10B_52490 [Bradyrhizobium diazoefficiens]BCF27380.1 hypothetical protein XF14B_53320 [Bradyrhizobium diazoefficiens]